MSNLKLSFHLGVHVLSSHQRSACLYHISDLRFVLQVGMLVLFSISQSNSVCEGAVLCVWHKWGHTNSTGYSVLRKRLTTSVWQLKSHGKRSRSNFKIFMDVADESLASIFISYQDWLWEPQIFATSCLKPLLSCANAVESSPVDCGSLGTEYAAKLEPYLYSIRPMKRGRMKLWPKPMGQPAFATQHTFRSDCPQYYAGEGDGGFKKQFFFMTTG